MLIGTGQGRRPECLTGIYVIFGPKEFPKRKSRRDSKNRNGTSPTESVATASTN